MRDIYIDELVNELIKWQTLALVSIFINVVACVVIGLLVVYHA